jgi:RNA polymerase sigma-70 factor (ECF subfamily)
MQRFARRDAPAADVLYGRFSSRIYGLGIVMLGSDAAAQDLVQDTFVKLWRSADRYDASRGKLETWVLLVARSLAIDALRRRVLEARSLETLGRPPEADQRPQPDELAATADMAARARGAMDQLSGSSGRPSNRRTQRRARKLPRWSTRSGRRRRGSARRPAPAGRWRRNADV